MEAEAPRNIARVAVPVDRAAIGLVVGDGVADVRQVGTDLVRSPGDRLALDEARLAVLRVSEQPHERTRRPKYPLLLVLCRLFVVQRDAFVLGQLVLFHPLGLPVVLVLGCTRLCGVCGV